MENQINVPEMVLWFISENLGLRRDTISRVTLIEETGADSLDLVEIALDLEDQFHIEIPDEALDDFKNLGDVIDYVEKLVKK